MPSLGSYQGLPLVSSEVDFLKSLEHQLGRPVPIIGSLNSIDVNFGFKAEDNHITGLGLYGRGLSSLPENFHHLSHLKILELSANKRRLCFL